MRDPLTLILLLSGAATYFAAALLAYRYMAFGLILVFGFFLQSTIFFGSLGSQVGSVYVSVNDLVYVLLLLAGTMRVFMMPRSPWRRWRTPFLLLLLVLAFSYLRGVPENGFQSATNELRGLLFLVSGAVYFSSFRLSRSRFDLVARLWIGASAVLTVVIAVRWGAELLGLPMASIWATQGFMRVLDASETLFVAQASFLCLFLSQRNGASRSLYHFGLALFAITILLQHRTVWIVVLVACVLTYSLAPRLRPALIRWVAGAAVVAPVLLLLTFGGSGFASISDRSSDAGTAQWRIQGWWLLIERQLDTPTAVVFGPSFGTGFEREYARGYPVDVSPHSLYMRLLLRGGAVGLALWVWICGAILLALRRRTEAASNALSSEAITSHLLFVLLCTQLVYSISYEPSTIQSVPLGLAMSFALLLPRKSAAARRSAREASVPEWRFS